MWLSSKILLLVTTLSAVVAFSKGKDQKGISLEENCHAYLKTIWIE